MNNRIITSGGQVVTTMSGLGNSNSNKPVVVNAAQLGGALRQQIVVTQPATVPQQVRTVQVKQPQQTQSHNSGVSKEEIINSFLNLLLYSIDVTVMFLFFLHMNGSNYMHLDIKKSISKPA